MGIGDNKITSTVTTIQDLPVTPNASLGITAAQLQAYFDQAPEALRQAINGVIDDLLSTTDGASGADQVAITAIAGLAGTTVQSVLEAIDTVLDGDATDISDLQTDLAQEIIDRAAADSVLQAGIDTESSTRFAADTALQNTKADITYVDEEIANASPLTIPDGSITNQKLTDEPDGIKNAVYGPLHADGDRYVGNTKLIDNFQTLWTSVAGTVSLETSNSRVNEYSVRLTEPDNTAGTLQMKKDGVSLDLTILNNRSDSPDSDYLSIGIEISDASFFTQVIWSLSQDAVYSSTNRKFIVISSLQTGYKVYHLKKSDFTTLGTGAWDGIQSMRLEATTLANAQNEYVEFDFSQLVKSNAALTAPNPFQYLGVEEFDINGGELSVIEEFGTAKIIPLNQDNVINAFQGKNQFDNFIISAEMEMEDGGEDSGTIGYHVDSDNNIRAYFVNSTTYRIGVEIGGVTTNYDISVNAITTFARYSVQLQRSGEVLEVSLNILGDKSYTRNIDGVTINGGRLTYGTRTDAGKDRILSISITELPHAATAGRADVADRLDVIYKAGAFTADELQYGQYGIDTTNNRVYFKYSSTQVAYSALTVV